MFAYTGVVTLFAGAAEEQTSKANEPSSGPRRAGRTRSSVEFDDLPLLARTPRSWADLAVAHLGVFLADHAVCEQQAALSALNLVAHYPEDEELVDRMTALAAEEIAHFRRVIGLLRRRTLRPAKRRRNPYVQALRSHLLRVNEPQIKVDRLCVGALIEARSCERFTRVLEEIHGKENEDVSGLLADLGPAEKRHWEIFHALASRGQEPEWFATRWSLWLERERDANANGGVEPTVHG